MDVLSGFFFFKCSVTPNQRAHLWKGSVEQYRRLDDGTLGFNIFDYNDESHYRYLSSVIFERINNTKASMTKDQFVELFIRNQ